jgi:glycosyltransferase 2 family protein
LAVFDFDGTLLEGDSLLILARQLNTRQHHLKLSVQFLPTWLRQRLHLISADEAKEHFLALFITPALNLNSWVEGTFKETLLQKLKPQALARLRWHQQQGHRVIICSASPRFYLQPLADVLGVELLATELQQTGNHLLPHLCSPNCKGPEKVRRLEALVGNLTVLQIEVYGDSRGDKDLLQRADIPHYRSFEPDPRPYPLATGLTTILPIAMVGYGLACFWSQGSALGSLLVQISGSIGIGLLLVLLSYAIRFGRWRLLMNLLGQRPPPILDARIWMASYAFAVTPCKAGETVRSLLLKQRSSTPVAQSLAALVVERLTDGLAVLLLLQLSPWAHGLQIQLLPLGLMGMIGACLLLYNCRQRLLLRLKPLLTRLLPQSARESGPYLGQLLSPAPLIKASVLGAVAWSLEGTSLCLILKALGQYAINWHGAIIAHAAAELVGSLSLLPGGLVSTEAGMVVLLALQGVPLAIATPTTLLIRLMTLWFATGLGLICLILPWHKGILHVQNH